MSSIRVFASINSKKDKTIFEALSSQKGRAINMLQIIRSGFYINEVNEIVWHEKQLLYPNVFHTLSELPESLRFEKLLVLSEISLSGLNMDQQTDDTQDKKTSEMVQTDILNVTDDIEDIFG